jgi:hypothetical protein
LQAGVQLFRAGDTPTTANELPPFFSPHEVEGRNGIRMGWDNMTRLVKVPAPGRSFGRRYWS